MDPVRRQLGANPMTFLGLTGVRRLIVTCSSPKSRNYQVGPPLGEGLQAWRRAVSLYMGETAGGCGTLSRYSGKSPTMHEAVTKNEG